MQLAAGARLGQYEVVALLGAGGMGEVYRARDTKLERDVALKVLPESFAADRDRITRFEREAKTLAALNHPNIAQVYDAGSASGHAYLVMELVDGEDLSTLIQGARGLQTPGSGAGSKDPASGLGVPEALVIARQIALALEAAHEVGIVHRDLKPANVRVREDGVVKILDFGLAKAIAPERSGASEAMNSPTLTARATQMGVIMGTAAYMAPEQARGKAVDKRADIWAFGCVLYEMVTGKRLFVGEDLTETLASVVKENPSLEHAPPGLQRLLRKCLEKDPKRRLRDIGDAWDLLEDATPRAAAAPSAAARTPWLAWASAALATLAAIALAVMYFGRPAPAQATRAEFHVAWPLNPTGPAIGGPRFFEISPDGQYIALVSQNALWVRAINAIEPLRLERTQGVTYPFWSPDGDEIAFFQDGQLKAIARAGGPVRVICDAADARGGAWSSRGTIIFASAFGTGGLLQVSEQGGTPRPATTLGAGAASDDGHRYPQVLPDGNRFLYMYLTAKKDVAGIYVSSLDGMTPVRVLEGGDSALFTKVGADGFLLFLRRDALMAQAFDPNQPALSGAPFVAATGVGRGENTGLGGFSVANNGTIAHGRQDAVEFDVAWLDRSGKRLTTIAPDVSLDSFSLAPDQSRVVMSVRAVERGEEFDLWMQSSGGSASKFTFGSAPGWAFPLWSPKGDQIAFATIDLAGLAGYEIRRKPANMSGVEEVLVRSAESIFLWDWSRDGKLVYATGGDLYLLSLEGDRKPVPFVKTPADEQYGQISPNGRWMAYTSGSRGSTELYVQPIPATGALRQVARGVASMPRWRDDGKELFYRGADGRLMAVTVTETSAEGVLTFGSTPQALFPVPSPGNYERFTYEPSADGSRFLVSVPASGVERPLTVVLNWRGK